MFYRLLVIQGNCYPCFGGVFGGWWDCFGEDAIQINFYILSPAYGTLESNVESANLPLKIVTIQQRVSITIFRIARGNASFETMTHQHLETAEINDS